MPVIHLKDRSTTEESDFNDQKSSQVSFLLINKDAKIETFSLELTVGTAWAKVFSPKQKTFVQIDEAGIQIGRHDSIVIEVSEDIHVPNNMYGLLVPTGSLFLGKGILIAPAKIEPGYSGKLTLRLFNTTSEKYILKTGDKLGSAVFFPTDATIDHATQKRERGANVKTPSRTSQAWKWIASNPIVWITLLVNTIGSSTVAALLTFYILNNHVENSNTSTQATSEQPANQKPEPQQTKN